MVSFRYPKDVLDCQCQATQRLMQPAFVTLHSNLCSQPLWPAGAPDCNADAAVSLKPRKLRTHFAVGVYPAGVCSEAEPAARRLC